MHILIDKGEDRKVLTEWLPATARAMEHCSHHTGMGWLRVKLGPNMALESGTAQYAPAAAEIQVNTTRMLPGVDPASINVGDELFTARYPIFTGGFYHELGHAKYSVMLPPHYHAYGLSPMEIEILMALEEPRVEYLIQRDFADASGPLGDVALRLVGAEFKGAGDAYSGSIAVAILLGRYIAGTISEREAAAFRAPLTKVLSDDQIDAFLTLADEYITRMAHLDPRKHYAERDRVAYVSRLQDLAQRWIAVLGTPDVSGGRGEGGSGEGEGEGGSEGGSEGSGAGEGTGEATEGSEGSEGGSEATEDAPGGEGGSGAPEGSEGGSEATEGEGSGEGESRESGDRAKEMGGEGGGANTGDRGTGLSTDGPEGKSDTWTPVLDVHGSHDDAWDDDDEAELSDLAAELAEAAAEARVDRDNKRLARIKRIKATRSAAARRELAKRHRAGKDANHEAWEGRMANRKREVGMRRTKPTADMRRAAVMLKRALVKATFQDTGKVSVAQAAPAKRLRGRAAVQRRAALAQGRRPDALLWAGNKRVEDAPDVPLRVGVLTDVSGSMGAYQIPSATINFVVGNAVTSMGGHYANFGFGLGAYGIVRNGHKVRDLIAMSANEGTENIRDAVLALDREIDLIDGDGVKVLVLLSDGQFVAEDQARWADKMFPELVARGVVLIHVDLDSYGGPTEVAEYRHGNPIPPLKMDPRTPPAQIAQALADVIVAEVARRNAAA